MPPNCMLISVQVNHRSHRICSSPLDSGIAMHHLGASIERSGDPWRFGFTPFQVCGRKRRAFKTAPDSEQRLIQASRTMHIGGCKLSQHHDVKADCHPTPSHSSQAHQLSRLPITTLSPVLIPSGRQRDQPVSSSCPCRQSSRTR